MTVGIRKTIKSVIWFTKQLGVYSFVALAHTSAVAGMRRIMDFIEYRNVIIAE